MITIIGETGEDKDVRITREAKVETRRKILDVAQELFRTVGYDATTTRDIAKRAEIATGTLFNYFPTKETIVVSLVTETQPPGAKFKLEDYETLEEALFAYAAKSLRDLKPYRKYLLPVLETTWSPFANSAQGDTGHELRGAHLETVGRCARRFVDEERLTPAAMQMYWTLYLGVLSFWINDKSPKQEDTLALLDQSTAMFVGWLQSD
jgi:AcrR family transcriptional regulator